MANESYYDILGISDDSDSITIRKAYRHKLLAHHPDKKSPDDQVDDSNIINKIQEAYSVLSKRRTREEYNKGLIEQSRRDGTLNDGEGLDMYDLDDFKIVQVTPMEEEIISESCYHWVKDCPRCLTKQGFILTEMNLSEQGTKVAESGECGRYEVLAQCNSCSLWLKIIYYDLDEADQQCTNTYEEKDPAFGT